MAQIEDVAPSSLAAIASILLLVAPATQARAEDAKQIVQEAVKTEIAAGKSDHSKWLYYETDRKVDRTVKQWVALTSKGELDRVLEENGRATNEQEQKSRMESFIRDTAAQQKRAREGQHDDRESTKMLS